MMPIDNTSSQRHAGICGSLEAWSETGSEGVHWCVHRDDSVNYEGLYELHDGDHLIIYERCRERIIWQGEIELEYASHVKSDTPIYEGKKQCVLGYWVNGLQRGVDAEAWARWFFDGLPAVLEPCSL